MVFRGYLFFPSTTSPHTELEESSWNYEMKIKKIHAKSNKNARYFRCMYVYNAYMCVCVYVNTNSAFFFFFLSNFFTSLPCLNKNAISTQHARTILVQRRIARYSFTRTIVYIKIIYTICELPCIVMLLVFEDCFSFYVCFDVIKNRFLFVCFFLCSQFSARKTA